MKRIIFSFLGIVYMPYAVAQTTGYAPSLEQEVEVIMSGKSAMKNKVFFYINETKAKYNFGVPGFELFKGLPMEYENSQMGLIMKHVVIKRDQNAGIEPDIFNMEK